MQKIGNANQRKRAKIAADKIIRVLIRVMENIIDEIINACVIIDKHNVKMAFFLPL